MLPCDEGFNFLLLKWSDYGELFASLSKMMKKGTEVPSIFRFLRFENIFIESFEDQNFIELKYSTLILLFSKSQTIQRILKLK